MMVTIMTAHGPRSFRAKPKRSPAKTLAQLNKRLAKLSSPKMRKMARDKWLAARAQ